MFLGCGGAPFCVGLLKNASFVTYLWYIFYNKLKQLTEHLLWFYTSGHEACVWKCLKNQPVFSNPL